MGIYDGDQLRRKRYDEGTWHISFVFRLRGSVVPQAVVLSLPSVLLSIFLCMIDDVDSLENYREDAGMTELVATQIWTVLTAVMILLFAFRSGQALGRFWEGTGLLHQMRGEWFDAISCLMAFSRQSKPQKDAEVWEFRMTLVRLTSLMHGCALHEIKAVEEQEFEVVDLLGLDKETLLHLQDCKRMNFNLVEVILHMIQVLITENETAGVLKIAPPILSRVYQQLSRGMVNLHNAKKITDTQFPFPYAQLILWLLLMYSIFSPFVFASIVKRAWWAAIIVFVPVFGMHAVNITATELEMPFGDDENDLPLLVWQEDMNRSLLMLIHANADHLPCTSPTAVTNFLQFKDSIHEVDIDSFTDHYTTYVDGCEVCEVDIDCGTSPPRPHDDVDVAELPASSEQLVVSLRGSCIPSVSSAEPTDLSAAFESVGNVASERETLRRRGAPLASATAPLEEDDDSEMQWAAAMPGI